MIYSGSEIDGLLQKIDNLSVATQSASGLMSQTDKVYMCEKAAWKPVTFVIVSIVVAVGAYFIFRQFIYVKLPTGILKGVLG